MGIAIAQATLQSLVNEHVGVSYKEALEEILAYIAEAEKTKHNSAMVPCKACQPMRKCTHGFAGKCRCVPCMLAQAPVARDVVCN
jgi:hypothetical protein